MLKSSISIPSQLKYSRELTITSALLKTTIICYTRGDFAKLANDPFYFYGLRCTVSKKNLKIAPLEVIFPFLKFSNNKLFPAIYFSLLGSWGLVFLKKTYQQTKLWTLVSFFTVFLTQAKPWRTANVEKKLFLVGCDV